MASLVDDPTKVTDKFGTGRDGWTEGNPDTELPATILKSASLNWVQENIVRTIENADLTPTAGDFTQLTTALQTPVGVFKTNVKSTISLGNLRFLNNRFVGVGEDEGIVSQVNPLKFTTKASGTGETIFDVAYSSSLSRWCFVGGNGKIWTKDNVEDPTDGSLTVRTADGSYTGIFKGVVWDEVHTTYIAVGHGFEVQTSPDGITWTEQQSGASDLDTIAIDPVTGITVWGGEHSRLQRTTDGGQTIEEVATNGIGTYIITSLKFLDDGFFYFVSAGSTVSNASIQRSPDALVWTELLYEADYPISGNQINDIDFLNNLYFISTDTLSQGGGWQVRIIPSDLSGLAGNETLFTHETFQADGAVAMAVGGNHICMGYDFFLFYASTRQGV